METYQGCEYKGRRLSKETVIKPSATLGKRSSRATKPEDPLIVDSRAMREGLFTEALTQSGAAEQ